MLHHTRREFLSMAGKGALGAGLLGGALAGAGAAFGAAAGKSRPNVLFIAVDDLRTQLGCYGHGQMISPNIDRLAAGGALFERAYCQQAVCAPSRASLLSGCRPDTTRIYDLNTPLRKAMPDVLSLPQHFKNHGYTTYSLGKIYHHRSDDLVGWSNRPFHAQGAWQGRGYLDPASVAEMQKADAAKRAAAKQAGRAKKAAGPSLGIGPAFEGPDVADGDYPDGKNVDLAIAQLRKWAKTGEPFFLALGLYKPHLPFNAPRRYWDMYPRDRIQLPTNTRPPTDAPDFALTNWGELRQYTNIPKQGRCDDALARTLIRAYYACVTYIDALLGRVLAELDRLKLRDNTAIVLWGDHGWKLGEYGCWSKHTNFELDTHAPLLLAGPGIRPGTRTRALTEFVDIYPTLCELCGLPVPDHCEGVSLLPLMKAPDRPWKTAAFSQYPRGRVMGYSMRTDRYRYNRWIERKGGKVLARELYDHEADPGENANLAGKPACAELVKRLDAQCAAGWKAARPKG
jgi:arylsulfatase A-like enzyme